MSINIHRTLCVLASASKHIRLSITYHLIRTILYVSLFVNKMKVFNLRIGWHTNVNTFVVYNLTLNKTYDITQYPVGKKCHILMLLFSNVLEGISAPLLRRNVILPWLSEYKPFNKLVISVTITPEMFTHLAILFEPQSAAFWNQVIFL